MFDVYLRACRRLVFCLLLCFIFVSCCGLVFYFCFILWVCVLCLFWFCRLVFYFLFLSCGLVFFCFSLVYWTCRVLCFSLVGLCLFVFFSCGLVVFCVFLLWTCGFFVFVLAACGAVLGPNLADQRGAKNSGAGLPPTDNCRTFVFVVLSKARNTLSRRRI